MKRLFIGSLTAAVIAAGTVSAIAALPLAATFTVVEQFDPPSGEFTSYESILCASGATSNSSSRVGFRAT